jgi:polyphosphate kinase 2 (PPK2 family)
VLDDIDLDRKVEKAEHRRCLPLLEARLADMEQLLLETRIPVAIVFEGWAGTSKIGTIGVLMRRLDPRGLRVHSVTPPRTYETQYPWLHRFWLKIPRHGQIAIFDRSWYRELLAARTRKQIDDATWRERCDDIATFERHLVEDGTVIVKFWLHISRKEQRHRFHQLESSPITAWQVTEEDHWQQRHYRRVLSAVEDLLARTDAPYAPWIALPATDRRYAEIAMFETVLGALGSRLGVDPAAQGAAAQISDEGGAARRHRLDELRGVAQGSGLFHGPPDRAAVPAAPAAAALVPHVAPGILRKVDLSRQVEPAPYERQLARLQAKLHLLGFQIYLQKRPVVLIFEGWDAAGKGGAIHRITAELDPRSFVVHPIAAPAGDDMAHHYLYRFWRRLPPRGQIALFDRSWYGRVLVERVEGFARPDEWRRAYDEINQFERQLVSFGTIICKFWMHISPEEQLRRFEERQQIAIKAWKLTSEDWRNREQWPQYEQAADEMLLRTSTPAAPWTIVEAEDKRFGRIKVLRTVVRRLEDELGKVKL